MRYGKRKAAPEGGGGGTTGKLGGASEKDAKRTARFVQAHSLFTPSGLTPAQAERHKADIEARLRLGLPLRRSEEEGRQ